MKNDELRIGVVGAGFIGERHVPAWHLVKGARVVGIAEMDETKRNALAKEADAPGYKTMEEMIERANLDVLDICLPSTLHRKAAEAAFDAGLAALVEKPFAISLEDIDAMIDASRKSGQRMMVAHVCRFKPEYMYLRSTIDSGTMGKPLFFSAWRESFTPTWSWNSWLLDRSKSGGTIMDLSIHDLDISNWCFGAPADFMAREVVTEPGGPSHVVSALTYPSGGRSSIEASHLMPQTYPFTSGFRMLFEEGTMECEFRENSHAYVEVFTESGRERKEFSELPPILGTNPYAEELQHFSDRLRDGDDFKISLQDARLAVETALKLISSLETTAGT